MSFLWNALYSLTSCCFPTPILHINRQTFKVIKLLGEGGYSFVFLVQDTSTGNLYALKKIRCPFGTDSVKDAMKEVDNYKLFQHENIIRVIDTYIVQDKDGSRIVYILLPYYKNGNLQDAIDNMSKDSYFSEKEILKLFRGVCYAVRALHTYQFPCVPTRSEKNDAHSPRIPDEDSQGDDNVVPFAHRDIKPGNVLLSDDMQTPILMDFGSLVRARIKVIDRTSALTQQDLAAANSTMPYRAPELFDVRTNTDLTEKVDIWSLGCTLFAMAYGASPFEHSISEQGGSMALAVLNNQFKFPENDQYSQDFRDLVSFILKVDPKERPDIHMVIERVDILIEQLDS